MSEPVYDSIGVGIGPFNLSAAALSEPVAGLRTRFFDRAPEFAWHPGLLISGSTIQTSHLKDLVTLADPTSKYSFLAYLHEKKRMYRFITANFPGVERAEFNDYFKWTSQRLSNLQFGYEVRTIEHRRDHFVLNGDESTSARHLVLGTGLSPNIPDCAREHLGDRVFHAHQLLYRDTNWQGLRVAIIGGGQTSAEVLSMALSRSDQLPSELIWVSSRENFLPLDDSPFTNELFTPGYSNFFYELPEDKRLFCLQSQKLASDGISMGLLSEIYRRIYSTEFMGGEAARISLKPQRRLVGMRALGNQYELELQHLLTEDPAGVKADVVVLCTGYRYERPSFLSGLGDLIPYGERGYEYQRDFSIKWRHHPQNKIYIQNAALNARGVADPNLSLMAWRSANIVNALAGRPVYKVADSMDLDLWR